MPSLAYLRAYFRSFDVSLPSARNLRNRYVTSITVRETVRAKPSTPSSLPSLAAYLLPGCPLLAIFITWAIHRYIITDGTFPIIIKRTATFSTNRDRCFVLFLCQLLYSFTSQKFHQGRKPLDRSHRHLHRRRGEGRRLPATQKPVRCARGGQSRGESRPAQQPTSQVPAPARPRRRT